MPRVGEQGIRKPKSKGKPPVHQNVYKYGPCKASESAMKMANSITVGLCQKCTEVVDWKKRIGKYKPLKVPGVCLECKQKNIIHAYHVICEECCERGGKCGKCNEKKELVNDFRVKKTHAIETPKEYDISEMNERRRRTFLRLLDKGISHEEAYNKVLSICGNMPQNEVPLDPGS